jgi:autophagy-related protein 16
MCASSCGALCMTVDGNIVVSGHFDGTLRFWDVRKGDIVHEVEGLHSLQMTSVVLSPSGCEVRLVADVL